MIDTLCTWIDRCLFRLEAWVNGLDCCQVCWYGFVPRGTGRTKKRYCSNGCASKARRKGER